MNKNDVLELLEYNRWAKERLIGSLEQMKPEDFEKDLRSSHGGIRGTLLHVLFALNTWSGRLMGDTMAPLDEEKLQNVSDFKYEWGRLEKTLVDVVDKFIDDQLQSRFEYQDTKGNKYSQPRIWALQQLFNHFTYHRGQIVTMQRQLGYKPVNTDLIGFYREKRS